MYEEVVLDRPLMVFKDEHEMSCPQKCKISQNSFNFPASSLVKIKSRKTIILCRVYYLNECYNSKYMCYIDDSVQMNGEFKEIQYVEKLELIDQRQITQFNEVKINLLINPAKLDLRIIKSRDDFVEVVRSILKHYTFTANCSISCNKFGISRIVVTSTDDLDKYGTLDVHCMIRILEIHIETEDKWKYVEIGGLKEEEEKLSTIIENCIKYAKKPRNFPTKPTCQVLISGPIGCGKSSLIHKVSNALKCNLFEITTDIFKPHPGETEGELQKMFKRIEDITELIESSATIILIENIELFCPKIDSNIKDNSHSARISSMIYSLLDDITKRTKRILVIGTTSKIELIDIALQRSSRLGLEIALELPNEQQRHEITEKILNRMINNEINVKQGIKIDDDKEEVIKFVAKNSYGFVGADLEILCQRSLRANEKEEDKRQHPVEGEKLRTIVEIFQDELKKIYPSALRDNFGTVIRSTMKFSDITGMEGIKKQLLTSVLGPLQNPEKFEKFGLKTVSGILLYGASGCAKTTLVKCLAGECNMNLISVSSAEIYSPYVGEAEKFIVKLFHQARLNAPAILFFDEIDTIVGNRTHSDGSNDAHMRILSTLLTEIDGFGGDRKTNTNKPVIIIGATNRPECIDNALMRPGRFDKLIHIPVPDYEYRLQILKSIFENRPIAHHVDVEDIARRTENFSGADLVYLCNEAGLCAATRDLNCDSIIMEDFENVFKFVRPSITKEKIEFYERFERYHSNKAVKMEN